MFNNILIRICLLATQRNSYILKVSLRLQPCYLTKNKFYLCMLFRNFTIVYSFIYLYHRYINTICTQIYKAYYILL